MFSQETIQEIPVEFYDKLQPYSFDIGSTLAKVVYKDKSDAVKDGKYGLVRCRFFQNTDIDGIIGFLKDKCDMSLMKADSSVHCVGITAFNNMDTLKDNLGISKLECLHEYIYQVNWLLFLNKTKELSKNIEEFDRKQQEDLIAEYKRCPLHKGFKYEGYSNRKTASDELQFPFLLANSGSGNFAFLIESSGQIQRWESYAPGGKAFQTLARLAIGSESFEDFMQLAASGDRTNTDVMATDVTGKPSEEEDGKTQTEDSVKTGAEQEEEQGGISAESCYTDAATDNPGTVFFMGKVANNLAGAGKYKREDLAASLMAMWVSGMVEYLYSRARAERVKQVVLYGSFVQNPQVRKLLTHFVTTARMRWFNYGQEVIDFLLVKNSSFIGALGSCVWPVQQNTAQNLPIAIMS